MELSFRQLEIFRTLMRTGNMTTAAMMLRSSQPTVSREIARMEEICKIKLFNRVSGRLVATTQATMLFEEVERSFIGLGRINTVIEAIRRFEYGQLSITCLPLFSQTLVPSAISLFRHVNSQVSISVVAQESPQLEESLSEQRYDLGLIELDDAPRGTSAKIVFEADMVCVLPLNHPLTKKKTLSAKDFQDVDFINLSGIDVYRHKLEEHFRSKGVSRHVTVEANSSAAVCAMVRKGIGVTIMNPLTAHEENGRGVEIRRLDFSIPYHVVAVRPSYRASSHLTDILYDDIVEAGKKLSASLHLDLDAHSDDIASIPPS